MIRWLRVAGCAVLGLLLAPALWAGGCRLERFPALSVTLHGLDPMVQVRLNGAPARFIVDTGSFWSILSPQAQARYHLPERMSAPGLFVEGANGSTDATVVTVRTLTFLHQALHNVPFIVTGNDYQSGAAGVLGDNFWHVADVEFDFAKGQMRLIRATGCAHRPLAYWAGNQPLGVVRLQAYRASSPQPIGHARIDGERIRVMFDTGSPRSILTLAAAKRVGITPSSPGVQPAGRIAGIARQWQAAWIAPLASFEIGGETIEHTHILVNRIHSLDGVQMYLGADFFLSHHIYLANRQHRLYFTYNGGPVFALGQRYLIKRPGAAAVLAGPGTTATPGSAPVASAPGSAGALAEAGRLARQGMALHTEGRDTAALARLNRACQLDPASGQYRYQRGRIHRSLKQRAAALADFDAAITLAPTLHRARLARAALLLNGAHVPASALSEARTDVNIVALQVPDASELLLPIASLYARLDQYADAIREIGLWVHYHPHDALLPAALSDRCWFRAEAGVHLHAALQDCDRALGWLPKSADILDSRGLVQLRLGRAQHAIADYDAALRLNPRIATSLYGRGLAERRLGESAAARADLAAAAELDPGIARRFARMRLAP